MNKITLIGRLTSEPTIKTISTGKKVATFSLAVSDGKDQSGQNLTQYFNCTAWDKKADVIENYVQKGHQLAIVGKLQNRVWDKPDGTKGYATDILVSELEMLTTKGSSPVGDVPMYAEMSSEPVYKTKEEVGVEDIDLGNMPF